MAAQLRFSPLACGNNPHLSMDRLNFSQCAFPCFSSLGNTNRLNPKCLVARLRLPYATVAGGGGGGNGGYVGLGGGGGGGGDGGGGDDDSNRSFWDSFGPIGAFLSGWRSRVAADPQFPFKVLMEELVGVTANVLGDMASRPNFGLNELDFVFSTLVVGSIMNFVLMYLLAPTMSASVQTLPSIFAACPTSHMFEPGSYGLLERLGTFAYKGILFAGVGFTAGLAGTALSNGLIAMRKSMDPNFETPNKPPPTLLNAMTWAIHMGVSANLRYQSLNGIEFVLANGFPPVVFKTSVVILRSINNLLGGMTFVMLARLTGSQSVGDQEGKVLIVEDGSIDKQHKVLVVKDGSIDKHRLLIDNVADDHALHNDSSSK